VNEPRLESGQHFDIFLDRHLVLCRLGVPRAERLRNQITSELDKGSRAGGGRVDKQLTAVQLGPSRVIAEFRIEIDRVHRLFERVDRRWSTVSSVLEQIPRLSRMEVSGRITDKYIVPGTSAEAEVCMGFLENVDLAGIGGVHPFVPMPAQWLSRQDYSRTVATKVAFQLALMVCLLIH
jgi:hypothetical protein